MTYQPLRLKEGYGFHNKAVETLRKKDEVNLFITVDVGITAGATVSFAKTLGADVIITDHHLSKGDEPPAVAVVNPNKGNCSSELNHLCGAGVAFYLLWALKEHLEKEGYRVEDFRSRELLDLFAIATLTDMVPLVRENRTLVKHGLVQLKHTKRWGLRCLLKELKLDNKDLTSSDVAIRFAPKTQCSESYGTTGHCTY